MQKIITVFLGLLILFTAGCSDPKPNTALYPTPIKVQPTIGIDLTGARQDIAQYEGKVLLVDFWATWCGPCLVKFPHMKNLKEKYAGRPFEILGISADYALSDVTDFLEGNDLPWDIWYAGFNQGVIKEWNIKEFPSVFLIDHKGMLIAKNPTNAQLDAILEKYVRQAENLP